MSTDAPVEPVLETAPRGRTHVSQLLDLANEGDPAAHERLIAYASDRLRVLAHVMLRSSPVCRWEQTDDLLQQTLCRLHRSLAHTSLPGTAAFLSLAALEMRHALVDLGRHYFGPLGLGANHASDPALAQRQPKSAQVLAAKLDSPEARWASTETWHRLYQAMDSLPCDERQVVDLMWIHELSQVEASVVLGVATKTIARRWRRAKLKLAAALEDELDDT